MPPVSLTMSLGDTTHCLTSTSTSTSTTHCLTSGKHLVTTMFNHLMFSMYLVPTRGRLPHHNNVHCLTSGQHLVTTMFNLQSTQLMFLHAVCTQVPNPTTIMFNVHRQTMFGENNVHKWPKFSAGDNNVHGCRARFTFVCNTALCIIFGWTGFCGTCVVGITRCSQRAMFSAYQRLEEEEGARQCSVW